MSTHRKRFSFENSNEITSVFDNLNLQTVTRYLDANPNFLNQKDEKLGCTLLSNAVQNGNYELVQFLLEKKSADPNIPNELGMTPLHYAVESGNHKMTNLLLEQGANPNIQQQDGETPLHIAANKGDYKVIKLLCLYGGNIHIKTLNNNSVLDYSDERGNQKCTEVIKSLSEKQAFENNKNNIIDNTYNIYHYPEEYSGEIPTGFKTTKNSDSPINRIKENMNIPFYTPDFVYKDLNFQNFTSKNSRLNQLNYKGFSTNSQSPIPNNSKNQNIQSSNLTFENSPNFNRQENPVSVNDRGFSYYPDYNSDESKKYLDEYDSVNNNTNKKNYFSDKYSLRESSSFFIQMNDFEHRLEKIKKELIDNVASTYEKNIDLENENITTVTNIKDNIEALEKNVNVDEDDNQKNFIVNNNGNYFSLATPNYNLNISDTEEENNKVNHENDQEELDNIVNIENLNTPYLNTYSSNSKYTSSYPSLAQKLTFNNIERKLINRSENYGITFKAENENKALSHNQESMNYISYTVNNTESDANIRNINMPRRIINKEDLQNISPILKRVDDDQSQSITSIRKKDQTFFVLNPEDHQYLSFKPNYMESDKEPNIFDNRVYTPNTEIENKININFNENNEYNNVYDYYYNVPAVKNTMSNNIFSLSNTKTNEYLISDLELTNEISKIKKLLSESFYDEGRVLTTFYSNKNDINENYVKNRATGEERTSIVKSKNQNNTFGETIQNRKIIEELFNFNLQEFEEYIKSSVLKDRDEEDDEEVLKPSKAAKDKGVVKNQTQQQKKNSAQIDLLQSTNSLHSQSLNKDGNFDKISNVPGMQNNNSSKYVSKYNPSLRDDKLMSLDTYTIDEVSVTICPKSINETLDKMNMITADIKQNGIDQIEFEYNSTEAMKEVDSFLKSMELEKYTSAFIKNGFDDLKMVIDQMQCESAVTDRNLKEIGIDLPGHRAKILLKLEESKYNLLISFI